MLHSLSQSRQAYSIAKLLLKDSYAEINYTAKSLLDDQQLQSNPIAKSLLTDPYPEIQAVLHRVMTLLAFKCPLLLETQVVFLSHSLDSAQSDTEKSQLLINFCILLKRRFECNASTMRAVMGAVTGDAKVKAHGLQVLCGLIKNNGVSILIECMNELKTLVLDISKCVDEDLKVLGYAYANLLLELGSCSVAADLEINELIESLVRRFSEGILAEIERHPSQPMDLVEVYNF